MKVFSPNVSKLHSTCPKEHMEKILSAKLFFFQFRILIENFPAFCRNFSRRLSKVHFLRPEQQLEEVGISIEKKVFIPFCPLSKKIRIFWQNIFSRLLNTAFYLSRRNSWGKKFCSTKKKERYYGETKETFSNNKDILWMTFWCFWMFLHSKICWSRIQKNLSSEACCFWATKMFVVVGTFWCYLPLLRKDCTCVRYNGLGKKVEDQCAEPKIGRKSRRYVHIFCHQQKVWEDA